MRLLTLVFCSALSLSAAFAQDAPEAPASAPARAATAETLATQQRLANLLPSPLPAAAVATAPITYYSADDLYKYMDGGADIYQLYNLQQMLHHESRAKEADVTADIYDMGSAENAFGMYASERSPGYDYIALGAEGYRNQGIVNFLQGQYYVKLAGFGPGVDDVLEQFARAISARIGGPRAFPTLLESLPRGNRKARSEQYLLKDPLGHAFLGPAYLATYMAGAKESTLLVSVAGTEAEALERLQKLSEHFRKSGQCEAAPALGQHAIRASNSFEGATLALARGRYLLVVFGAQAGSEELLTSTSRQLP